MEFYVNEFEAEGRLELVEDGEGSRYYGFFLLVGGVVMNLTMTGDLWKMSWVMMATGVVAFVWAATQRVELLRAEGEVRVEKRRVLSFMSSQRVIPVEEVVVPEVVFQRQGFLRIPMLCLKLHGEQIRLHTFPVEKGKLKKAHDKIWEFLELSPGEAPPDPFPGEWV